MVPHVSSPIHIYQVWNWHSHSAQDPHIDHPRSGVFETEVHHFSAIGYRVQQREHLPGAQSQSMQHRSSATQQNTAHGN